MTLADAHRLFSYIQAHNPEVAYTDDTVKAWAHALQRVEARAVLAAVNGQMRASKWAPKLADVLDFLADRICRIESPETAWLEVERAIGRWGRYRPWKFENPATELATEFIGKDGICNASTEEMGRVRAQWTAAYRGFVAQERTAAKEALMTGVEFRSVLEAKRRAGELPAAERTGPKAIGELLPKNPGVE